jgi:hypothetical protein
MGANPYLDSCNKLTLEQTYSPPSFASFESEGCWVEQLAHLGELSPSSALVQMQPEQAHEECLDSQAVLFVSGLT